MKTNRMTSQLRANAVLLARGHHHTLDYWQGFLILASAAALLLVGCAGDVPPRAEDGLGISPAAPTATVQAAPVGPSAVAPVPSADESRARFKPLVSPTGRERICYFIAIDNSISSKDGRNRRPSIDELEPAYDRLLKTGGRIRIVEIGDGARPVRDHSVSSPPPSPDSASAGGSATTLFDQAVVQAEQQAAKRRYAVQYDAWYTTERKRLAAFRLEIDEVFHPLALSHETLLGPVLRQADAFFSEPGQGSYVPALIIVSDVIDTGSRPEDLQFLWSRPNVVVVNDSGDLGSLAHLRAHRFTSLARAITFFDSATGAGS